MGTDIHLYVEKYENGQWHEIRPPYCTWYGEDTWSPVTVYNGLRFKSEGPDPETRDYNLFAFLAGVRNGYGFAGVASHRPITPQFPGRGIPGDTSWHEDSGTWLGDHSFTWATLTELINAPWDMEFHSTGVVGRKGYASWKKNGVPSEWSLSIIGRGVRLLSLDVFDELYRTNELKGHEYTRVHWTWKPLENCDFKRWVFEILLPMADGDTNSVRVLMGFDS